MKTAQEIADQAWFELTVLLPAITGKVADACKETLKASIATALLEERSGCADTAHGGGMHYTQEQDIRDEIVESIMARPAVLPPTMKHRTIDVTVFGHDVPVEVEYTGDLDYSELYAMAKDLLRRAL